MAENKEPQVPKEPHYILSRIEVPYRYYVGSVASRFYTELRNNKKIMGIRCPQCRRVLMPPKSVCRKCFSKLDESMFVELSGKGEVTTYTVVHYCEPVHPQPILDVPFAYGIIQLDGTDTGMLHFLGEVDLDKITSGMKVEPVFKEERKGNILDIKYFKPV